LKSPLSLIQSADIVGRKFKTSRSRKRTLTLPNSFKFNNLINLIATSF